MAAATIDGLGASVRWESPCIWLYFRGLHETFANILALGAQANLRGIYPMSTLRQLEDARVIRRKGWTAAPLVSHEICPGPPVFPLKLTVEQGDVTTVRLGGAVVTFPKWYPNTVAAHAVARWFLPSSMRDGAALRPVQGGYLLVIADE